MRADDAGTTEDLQNIGKHIDGIAHSATTKRDDNQGARQEDELHWSKAEGPWTEWDVAQAH
jgi:hypothetical protein